MLRIVMEVNETIVLEKNNRPIKQNSLANFLAGVVSIPEEFENLFFKFITDKQNRTAMKLVLEEERRQHNSNYVRQMKNEILKQWVEM